MSNHMTVSRWDPFGNMLSLPDEVRDLFRDFYRDDGARWTGKNRDGASWMPAVDIDETDQAYVVKADLPGVDQKDVKVSIENQVLRLSGERRTESTDSKHGRHRVERSWGSFERSFMLPQSIDADHVKATYKDGVLSISLPKKETARQKLIEVKVT